MKVPDGVAVPSMFVSASIRRMAEPVASVIVTFPDMPAAGKAPSVIVTLLICTRRPSTASPAPPSASCDTVITCGAGGVVDPVGVMLLTLSSVRPLNCDTVPIASSAVPTPKEPKFVELAKRSMPPVASWR